MTVTQHRQKIGKFIIVAHLSIFGLIFILFGFGGFTPDEFSNILKFIVPIKSVYLTALLKFVIANRETVENKRKGNTDSTEVDKLYKTVTDVFIYSHIILLALAIVFAAFNVITFTFLQNAIAAIETFFGAYIGLIISDMFKVEE